MVFEPTSPIFLAFFLFFRFQNYRHYSSPINLRTKFIPFTISSDHHAQNFEEENHLRKHLPGRRRHREGAKMANQAFTVDLTKPVVFQVGHLGEAYDEWVHRPIVSKETPRFFENGLLEFFTRTAWWVVPLVWLPVACWFALSSLKIGLPPSHLAASVLIGILTWSLLEYTLHRILFHVKTKSYWGNTLHYLLHGCHHKHPMDSLRLVFPPAAALILAVPLWLLFKMVVPASFCPAFLAGGIVGYVLYDCTHYYLHHGQPVEGLSHELKQNHMHHHFKAQNMGYGITSNFWDRVFGTLPPKSSKKNS